MICKKFLTYIEKRGEIKKNKKPFALNSLLTFFLLSQILRDVILGKIQVRPLRWWAESAPPGWDRVKVSENLGATSVAPVAPADTSLYVFFFKVHFFLRKLIKGGNQYSRTETIFAEIRYSQVSIKQANSLNYFEEILHPARSYQSPGRLIIFDKKIQIFFCIHFFNVLMLFSCYYGPIQLSS